VPDGKVELVTSLDKMRGFAGTFGIWTGLDPNDSPLVLRDIGTEEIYSLDWQAR